MMPIFDHTPRIEKQTIELIVASHAASTIRPSRCYGHGTTCTHPFVYTCNKELPSHWDLFTLWTTQSRSLGVNPTRTSPTYKYAITGKSKWMSKAPLPSNSSSSLWEFPLLVLPWGTSTMKKKGVLQLALQLNFLVVKDTCNSLYLYIVSANGQIT